MSSSTLERLRRQARQESAEEKKVVKKEIVKKPVVKKETAKEKKVAKDLALLKRAKDAKKEKAVANKEKKIAKKNVKTSGGSTATKKTTKKVAKKTTKKSTSQVGRFLKTQYLDTPKTEKKVQIPKTMYFITNHGRILAEKKDGSLRETVTLIYGNTPGADLRGGGERLRFKIADVIEKHFNAKQAQLFTELNKEYAVNNK